MKRGSMVSPPATLLTLSSCVGRFRTTVCSGPAAARVTMTLMAARAFVYSVVRCPDCYRRLMDVPGDPLIQTRIVEADQASGRGRVVCCKRCSALVEVIEHNE